MLELLAPAGSPEAVAAAVQKGADAVWDSGTSTPAAAPKILPRKRRRRRFLTAIFGVQKFI